MKDLKYSFIIAALLASLLVVVSCKKNKESVTPPEPLVVGIWQGTATANNKSTSLKMNIKKDGTVTVTAQSIEFNGTWTLTGHIFQASFLVEGVKATAEGELLPDKKTINGKWTEDNNGKITTQDLALNKN